MMNLINISQQIEDCLVARNLRGMKTMQSALRPGYFLRAAKTLFHCQGNVLIGTGFPVDHTFETDGPVGAILLYNLLQTLGKTPHLVCGDPLYAQLKDDYRVIPIAVNDVQGAPLYAQQIAAQYQPAAIISIERPGLNSEGQYCNMRGEDISARCASFDFFMSQANCPTIAIGDGGNEIGMGNIAPELASLNIIPSVTECDELLVADVSNWGAYGLIGIMSLWHPADLLENLDVESLLKYLSAKGSVDGVTRRNELTEDSLCFSAGYEVLNQIRVIIGNAKN